MTRPSDSEVVDVEAVVAQDESDFRLTLVYADPPGDPDATIHAVNDLNLKVTSPSNDVDWGNCGLHDENVSSDGCTGGNQIAPPPSQEVVIDTVENVFIKKPEAGTWSVMVIAEEINADGHTETGWDDVDFALVVTGVTDIIGACCNERYGTCSDTTKAACQGPLQSWNPSRTCATTVLCASQN